MICSLEVLLLAIRIYTKRLVPTTVTPAYDHHGSRSLWNTAWKSAGNIPNTTPFNPYFWPLFSLFHMHTGPGIKVTWSSQSSKILRQKEIKSCKNTITLLKWHFYAPFTEHDSNMRLLDASVVRQLGIVMLHPPRPSTQWAYRIPWKWDTGVTSGNLCRVTFTAALCWAWILL